MPSVTFSRPSFVLQATEQTGIMDDIQFSIQQSASDGSISVNSQSSSMPASITLPGDEVFGGTTTGRNRAVLQAFSDSALYQQTGNSMSRAVVLSATTYVNGRRIEVQNLIKPVKLTFTPLTELDAMCVFWDENAKGKIASDNSIIIIIYLCTCSFLFT